MKMLVVYSSRTGNTRAVAEAVHAVMPRGTELASVETAPDPAGYDFIALGFWVDRGAPDAAMLAYMDRVKGASVGLFGTLGAWPDSEHARKSMQKGIDRLPDSRVLGTFMCQGRIDPRVLTSMAKMREKKAGAQGAPSVEATGDPAANPSGDPHPMTEERKARIAEAEKHPDANDLAAAQNVFTAIMRQLEAPCAS